MEIAAIEELYRKHGAMVLRRTRSILGDEASARDAMQDVFVQAIQEGNAFRGDASPVTWLYRIATNLCLNRIRDGARRRQLLAENAPAAEAEDGPTAEDRMTLAAVLARVPEELREIAVCYHVDQMNQDEIAVLLGVSRRTVGNRLEAFRAAAKAALSTAKIEEAS